MTDESKMPELKPCPFCGAEAAIAEYMATDGNKYINVWPNCRCIREKARALRIKPPLSDSITKEMCINDVITAWNTRTRAPSDAARGEALGENETVKYVLQYGGRCRGCADENGICPDTHLPCESREKSIRYIVKAINYGLRHGYLKKGNAHE